MRPSLSVAGTRCTRCPPASNLSRANTPRPAIAATTSLKPPRSLSLTDSISTAPALAARHSAGTCATGRRRTAPPRRRRCRRGSRGWRSSRRRRPWAAAAGEVALELGQMRAASAARSCSARSRISGSLRDRAHARDLGRLALGRTQRADRLDHGPELGRTRWASPTYSSAAASASSASSSSRRARSALELVVEPRLMRARAHVGSPQEALASTHLPSSRPRCRGRAA